MWNLVSHTIFKCPFGMQKKHGNWVPMSSLYGKNMNLLRCKIEFSPANLPGNSTTGI